MTRPRRAAAESGADVRIALAHDPLFALLRERLARPLVLGVVLALFAVLAVVFGPDAPAHFVYVDF